MRKYYYVTTFIIMLIVSFVGITYSYEYDNSESVKFDLIGPSVMYHDVNTDYEEYGIKVMYKNRDISDMVDIDSSKVDTTKLGEYKVKYTVEIDGMTEYIYRIVKVIDMSAPKIELNEGEEISILRKKTEQAKQYQEKIVLSPVQLPIKKGSVVGKLELFDNEQLVGSYDLIVNQDVEKKNFLSIFWDNVKDIVIGQLVF